MTKKSTGSIRGSKFTPCLWFDSDAEEAANFYIGIFKNSKITEIARYGEAAAKVSGRPEGSVMTVAFELDGQKFLGLNGGPMFTFSPAISFIVSCENQEEVDAMYENLSEGGAKEPCGWLKDRFGVSWQIVPTFWDEMMRSGDAVKIERAMTSLLEMKKPDIETLKRAYEGG